jgi:hypothetical protein
VVYGFMQNKNYYQVFSAAPISLFLLFFCRIIDHVNQLT